MDAKADAHLDPPPDPRRWVTLLILFTARFALGVQFQSAGSVTPFVLEEFGSGYAGLGTLVGLYLLPGILLTIPLGFMGQRFGDRLIVLMGLGLMVVGGLLSSLASDYTTLAAGRVIAGIGSIALFVLLTKMLADWFTGRELYFGMSLFILGWPGGIAAAQVFLPYLAEDFGWSMVFVLTSILCAIGLVSIAAFYRAPAGAAPPSSGRFNMLTRREVTLVSLAGISWMMLNGSYMVLLSFGPVRLSEIGVDFETASVIVSPMSWVAVISLPIGGFIASRFNIPSEIMVGGLAATVVANIAIPYTGVPAVAYFAYGFFVTLAIPVVGSLPAQVLAPENRGPGLGLFMIFNFVGMALFPILAGFVGDLSGSAEMPILLSAAMMACALLAAIAFLRMKARLAVAPA